MVKQGATFVVIKTKDGDVFGGYADDAWEYPPSTTWYGHSANFLFRLNKAFGVWDGANSSNDHYQYLCWGKKSLPNGFGMGGQFDYAGLWIDADFHNGHSRAGPLCTTYSSPQLSEKDKFIVDEIEVWLVRPLQRDEDEDLAGGNGILGRSEDMEFMEMAGKKMYSKDLAPVRTEDVVADDGGS
ncbi:TLD-domain-containing protein [Mycotypha africana]|uniref:TLD-domain-containing protein n=1 Tax=Mycotypha africana TaxID=64632 RepID=UPI0023009A55|nr:TLD-domain-containing protein [Mycotypha africana]KAI8987294.1 TLD-domain-containing protein [Mycotypha africana]